MPESLVIAHIEREIRTPPPLVNSRAKVKEYKQTGEPKVPTSEPLLIIPQASS
jgi:hypothetical protein